MLNWITWIGQLSINFTCWLGGLSLIFLHMLSGIALIFTRPILLIKQMYFIGFLSLLIIALSGFFVGMVLALQGFHILSQFGAESSLGVMIAATLVRELGPVVSALLFAGRAGSAVAAEIGLMKATEQLSALEMMAVDPVKRVLLPRLIAGVISLPLLSAIFSALGIIGGYIVGVGMLGVDAGSYWSQMQAKILFSSDILNGLIKSLIFGLLIILISLYEGFRAVPTSEGVGNATTRTVVNSAFAILGFDFILTALMFGT